MNQPSEEHLIPVQRTGRYYTLGQPGPHISQVWYVFHGYGQLGSYFIKHFESIADHETLVVAVEGLSLFYIPPGWTRVGATWMTKEKRISEIEDYLGYLDTVHTRIGTALPSDCTFVFLGFSQGATTAWRWARHGTLRPKFFVNWAGSIPNDGAEHPDDWAQGMRLHHVAATQDEYITLEQADKQTEQMRTLDPRTQRYTFDGNHRMDEDTLAQIQAAILRD